jgi:hypothetical protein
MRILRGVGSRMLPCGCLVGIYETYSTNTVALIDARGSGCLETTHRVNAAMAMDLLSPSRHPSLDAVSPAEPVS